jgi:hypothetical protein
LVKKPKIASEPLLGKTPSIGALKPGAYLESKPAWRFGRLRVAEPHGWRVLSREQMLTVIDRLKSFESMSWKEIEGRQNHWIQGSELIRSAQNCLEEDWQGADQVFSLRIDGATRIFGIIDQQVFYLLWYDPEHLIVPSIKKHT